MIWLLVAMAGTPDPALVREEGLVAEAAAAVAQGRRDGLRGARIAELMAAYREQAERLAAMEPAPDPAAGAQARRGALLSLAEATARGGDAQAARAVAEDWLGALPARLDVLDIALAAARTSPAEFGLPIAADVESQAVAVMVVAAYDASRADEAARAARTQAASLTAASSPFEQPGLSDQLTLTALRQTADAEQARATSLRTLSLRASALRDAARLITGQ